MSDNSDAIGRLAGALEQLQSDYTAEECHGILTGLFCARGKLEQEEWLAFIAPDADRNDLLVTESLAVLEALHAETLALLNDSNLGFQPLLPADDVPLAQRVRALGLWCDGFILGLSEGGIAEPAKLPGDSGEVIEDLLEIARIDSYDLSDDEEDEAAITELEEFVRTAVLLINEELNPTKAPPREELTLH